MVGVCSMGYDVCLFQFCWFVFVFRTRGDLCTFDSMNINGPPIMDMSMNPNGYHQPYLPQNMMPPPPPQHSGPSHHNEGGSNMSVGPPSQQQQQQPPPAHPTQSQSNSGSGGTPGGGSSNQGTASGGEGTSGIGHGSGSGSESAAARAEANKKKSWPRKKVYKKPDPNAPKQRRFSGKPSQSQRFIYYQIQIQTCSILVSLSVQFRKSY